MKNTILIGLFLAVPFLLRSQENAPASPTANGPSTAPSTVWELGLHAGHFFTSGNVDFIPGYAGGIHVRRALDYVFSLRLDLLYGSARGEDNKNARNFSNKWTSGTMQGIVSLNNLRWATGERKTNFYLLGGVGLNTFSVDFEKDGDTAGKVENDLALHSDLGAGIAFRINQRVNLGIEHKSIVVFGSRSDLPDGFETTTLTEDKRGTFRDFINYTSVRLNLNFGRTGDDKTEPLYWLNPLENVMNDVSRLKELETALVDDDQDGVSDRHDKDKTTLPNVLVNSKGQTLDSDGDRIADYLDKEPFSPPGYPVDAAGVAKQPDLLAEASKMVDKKLELFEKEFTPGAPAAPANPIPPAASVEHIQLNLFDADMVNLLLPTIYYLPGSSKVAGKDFVLLQNVGKLMKENANIRMVVTGHADIEGVEASEHLKLSHERALVVIDYLIDTYKLPRERFILQYKGNKEAFVVDTHEVNRRVRFRIATDETEMIAPK